MRPCFTHWGLLLPDLRPWATSNRTRLLWSSAPAVPVGPPLAKAHLWGERSRGVMLLERRQACLHARECPVENNHQWTGRSRLRDAATGHRCPQPPAAAGVTWATWKTHRSPGLEALEALRPWGGEATHLPRGFLHSLRISTRPGKASSEGQRLQLLLHSGK